MPVEDIVLHMLPQFLGGQVISDVGIAEARGDTDRPVGSGQQDSLGHTPAVPGFQGTCGTKTLG